jgi:opacity protein-like surface antigen
LHIRQLAAATLMIAATAAATASAQGKALVLFAQGGRQIPITNLSEDGDEIRPGWTGGGGLALQLNSNVALRASASLVSSEYRGSTLTLDDPTMRRTFVSFDLQTGLPTTSGWAPYLFAGAGWVQIDPEDSAAQDFTKFAARFGAGTNYVFDNAFFVLFLEAGTYLYDFSELGFSSYQFDLQFLLGLAYAIPL